MSRLIKIFLSVFLVFGLASCATIESPRASNAMQQYVKQKVLQELEKEYHKQFKIITFSYKYKSYSSPQNDCVFLFCKTHKRGYFYFKVKQKDNPLITMDFKIIQENTIQESIQSFNEGDMKRLYCWALEQYYDDHYKNNTKVAQPYTERAEKFCDARGQPFYERYKKKYLNKVA